MKWVVVGAGLTGATLAQLIAERRRERVVVVDRRDHVAGTSADFYTPEGVFAPRYGPHVFHTNSPMLVEYVSRFAKWRDVRYTAASDVGDGLVPLPVGFRGMKVLMGDKFPAVRAALLARYKMGDRLPVSSLCRHQDPLVRELGDVVRSRVFDGYTTKHWGLPVEAVSAATHRVPVVVGDQDGYHHAAFQAVPVGGYTEMVRRMLEDPLVTVETGRPFVASEFRDYRVVHTGPVDEHFGFQLGKLPYRSVRFEFSAEPGGLVLPYAALHYPDSRPYTRMSEPKRITGQDHPMTVLCREYPGADGDPLYPLPTAEARALHASYDRLVEESGIRFCGRLGYYLYLNMDQAIASAHTLFDAELS